MKLEDGWISLDTMTKFKRLAELSTNHDVIIEAMKLSNSKLMEIDESKKKIRRSKDKPLPEDNEEHKAEVNNKTVYCKGFPRQGMTIDKALEMFNQYEGVENIRVISNISI